MKLLYDENLAPSLVEDLADIFPESLHVREVGLKAAPDPAVCAYAATAGYMIVSKDADFRQRSFLYGHPPKVILDQARKLFNSRNRKPPPRSRYRDREIQPPGRRRFSRPRLTSRGLAGALALLHPIRQHSDVIVAHLDVAAGDRETPRLPA